MFEKIKDKIMEIDKEYIIIGIILTSIVTYIIITGKADKKDVEEEQKQAEIKEEEKIEESKAKIYVHIDGMVKKPGLIELKEDARLNEAIEKAEGLTEKADTELINLAMQLEDGTKIYIPSVDDRKKNEENKKENEGIIGDETRLGEDNGIIKLGKEDGEIGSNNSNKNSGKTTTKTSVASNNTNVRKKGSGKVNINKASKEQLMTIKGVGSSTADKIIEYRNKEGGFKKLEQLLEVSGIGESKFNKMKGSIVL